MSTVYISGKISGLPEQEYIDNFNRAEMKLKARGYDVYNPVSFALLYPWMSYDDYMDIDLAALEVCDAIYMMSNWTESEGAKLEHYAARVNKKRIIYESEG